METRGSDTTNSRTLELSDVGARLLTAKEVAAHFRISLASAYRLMRRRTLPTVRLGRSIRVPYSDLVQWLAERKQPALLD